MALAAGDRIGPHQIVELIGQGGMGEVYRARDTRLNRDVALKVLPEVFATDPDRLARFTREAQVLASLNHPNVAGIHGIEVNALVMEFVEGDDLSKIISRGPLPLSEVLTIARQIADAHEAAHEQGIVHGDLKPANIKIKADSTVKVLDFGLAKALGSEGSSAIDVMNSPTLTVHATQMGVILGTAAYMAPEQARGKVVDRRADIWAFGVVLYEMLTGRRAFDGDDVSITLASVLKDDPRWHELPTNLPPPITRLLRRCLEKDSRRRLSSIGDARLELEEREPEHVIPLSSAIVTRPVRWSRVAPALVGAGVAVAAVTAVLWSTTPASPGGALSRLSILAPPGERDVVRRERRARGHAQSAAGSLRIDDHFARRHAGRAGAIDLSVGVGSVARRSDTRRRHALVVRPRAQRQPGVVARWRPRGVGGGSRRRPESVREERERRHTRAGALQVGRAVQERG
ncbi:MAG TPA: serine/threonine-protein kinase [Vicinamibacterales bacterium]